MDNVARRRQQALRTKKTLNIGQEQGVPQAPVRQNSPPPQIPAADQPAEATPSDNMRAATERFFQQIQRPNAQPINEPQAVATGPQPAEGMVTDRIKGAGAQGRSTIQQFYQLSGRMPTPRDLAVFRTVQLLEDQLGRKPTRIELRVALSRPTLLGAQAPTVVEG